MLKFKESGIMSLELKELIEQEIERRKKDIRKLREIVFIVDNSSIKKRYSFWTKEEINKMIEMYKNGEPIKKIAEELGRTEGTVSMRLSQIKRSNPKIASIRFGNTNRWSKKDEERLLKLAKEGKNIKGIAKTLGRTEHSIRMKYYKLANSTKLPCEK